MLKGEHSPQPLSVPASWALPPWPRHRGPERQPPLWACVDFLGLVLGCFFSNKTTVRALRCEGRAALTAPPAPPCAPPQDGARRPEVALRQLPLATGRHGRDTAGAEPDAALEPVRGAGGGAAGPRGVAAGEGEVRAGARRGEAGREKRAARQPPTPPSPQQRGSASRNKS